MNESETPRILRLRAVQAATGLSRSSIYARAKRGDFPQQINLGGTSVGWLQREVVDWLRRQIAASRPESE